MKYNFHVVNLTELHRSTDTLVNMYKHIIRDTNTQVKKNNGNYIKLRITLSTLV